MSDQNTKLLLLKYLEIRCVLHRFLLEERREVGADTGLPRGGALVPALGGVAGQSTSHGSAKAMRSVMACEVS